MKTAQAVWAVVVLVIAILAALVILTALGRDTGPVQIVISSVVAPLLLALVYGEVRAVREQTNGTTSKLLDYAVKPMTETLAAQAMQAESSTETVTAQGNPQGTVTKTVGT